MLAGVTLGKYSVVRANCVINKNVPPNPIICRISAKIARNVNTSYRTVEE